MFFFKKRINGKDEGPGNPAMNPAQTGNKGAKNQTFFRRRQGALFIQKGPPEGKFHPPREFGKGNPRPIHTERPARKKPAQSFEQPFFHGMGQGVPKAPAGGVFEVPENCGGPVTEDCRPAALPEIKQPSSLLPAAPGIEVKVPGPEYRRQEPQEGRTGPREQGLVVRGKDRGIQA
jgi:hypothetical protein